MDWLPVALVLAAALIFAFSNGFQDASNSIAIPIATGSLSPRLAVTMAATLGLGGAVLGHTLADGFVEALVVPPSGAAGLSVIGAALVAATAWNLLMWWFGMPSSSTHALIGGLTGASLVAGTSVVWDGVWVTVTLPMLLSPLLGLVLACGALWLVARIVDTRSRTQVGRDMRGAQVAAAGAVALGNGLQDAAKTMAVVVVALTISGHASGETVPWWVVASVAVALSLGTYAGGWRIVRTLGRRIIRPAPDRAQGTVAQASTAAIQYLAAVLHLPVSSTHTVTAALVGAGLTGPRSALGWTVIRQILLVWVCTFPGAAALSALVCGVLLAL
ncbi:inorganic phosphate transporter [Ornithinimicrobium ciconiae]|uniref:inorganic phosphate transporter n=1 Tax=Ornithinimicrobium ciconiae TaxID=2594265 RepID=UPI0013FD075F|nr:inorganic phosphate transporter [Ornithinimicrobium ciconiae]